MSSFCYGLAFYVTSHGPPCNMVFGLPCLELVSGTLEDIDLATGLFEIEG